MSAVPQSPQNFVPDPWVSRFGPLVNLGGHVLDLASGAGRHARYFLDRGHPVTALDRSVSLLDPLKGRQGLEIVEADIESGSWPLEGRHFDGIVVVNYLHRPLLPILNRSLNPGGVLIYRTFGIGNEGYGKPSNPNFLLRPNELLETLKDLEVIAFESGDTGIAVVQRICAVKRDIRRSDDAPYPLPI